MSGDSGSEADDRVRRTDGGREPEELTDLNGIGSARADKLRDAGFETVADVRAASQEDLADVLGSDLARRVGDQLHDSGERPDSEETGSANTTGQESASDGPTVPWSNTEDQQSDDTGANEVTAAGDRDAGAKSGDADEERGWDTQETEIRSTGSADRDRDQETVSDDGDDERERDVDQQWTSDETGSDVDDEGRSRGPGTDEPTATASSEPDEGSGTKPPKGADEKYCRSCGAVIKKQAELCPKCGVRQQGSKRSSTGSGGPQDPASRLMAAGIGGVVSLFGGLLPVIGQILGGVVAGYLRGPDTRESTICGALAGLIASIPSALFFGFLLFLGIIGSAAGGGGFEGVVFLGILFVTVIGIYVGLGAAGGFVGAMISDRSPPDT
jgi:ribosomal protein L40E